MTTSTRQFRFLMIAVLLSFLVLSRGIRSVGQFFTNAGMLLISKSGVDLPDSAGTSDLNTARSLLRSSSTDDWTALHGLAIVDWVEMNDSVAVAKWQQAGFTAEDLITYARNGSGEPEHALRWYRSVAQMTPDNSDLWLDVGLICQQQQEKDELCADFLEYNEQNWLVDPHIEFGRVAWRFNRREGVEYDIVDCPDLPGEQCLSLGIGGAVPEHGASWQQCLYLSGEGHYRFSVMLRVETIGTGQWRPLYYQGDIAGQPRGFWPSTEEGSTDWMYWEEVFALSEFDDNRVCFHPIRFEGQGQVWLTRAKLQFVD